MSLNQPLIFATILISFCVTYRTKVSDPGSISDQIAKLKSAKIDSSDFSPDTASGWASYNSYVAVETDSVLLELIVYRLQEDSADWSQPQKVGNVRQIFRPGSETHILFSRERIDWEVSISSSGDCFLKYQGGLLPSYIDNVIAIQIKYPI